MLAIAVVLLLCLVVSGFANVLLVARTLQLVEQRDSLVSTIEESLDELDGCYSRFAAVAETPVLSDEPVVRDLLANVTRSKNAVLEIANRIVVYGDDGDEEAT